MPIGQDSSLHGLCHSSIAVTATAVIFASRHDTVSADQYCPCLGSIFPTSCQRGSVALKDGSVHCPVMVILHCCKIEIYSKEAAFRTWCVSTMLPLSKLEADWPCGKQCLNPLPSTVKPPVEYSLFYKHSDPALQWRLSVYNEKFLRSVIAPSISRPLCAYYFLSRTSRQTYVATRIFHRKIWVIPRKTLG
jgi:hypothetical protein